MLTYEKAGELSGALARLAEIKQSTIISKEQDAEARGLERFISDEAPKHLNELLGCWFTIRREYEPLLMTIASAAKRVQGILNVKLPSNENESATTSQS